MTPKAPWHLWLVGGLMTAWNGLAATDFTATVRQYEPYMATVAQPIKDYIYSLPGWTFAVWGIATWAGLLGSLPLLLRRADAVLLLAASLAAAGMLVVALSYPAPAGGSSPVFATLIVGIAALSLLYAIWMKRQRVLR